MRNHTLLIACYSAIAILVGAVTYTSRSLSFGAAIGLVALALWTIYIYSDSRVDRIYQEYIHYDPEMKDEFLAGLDSELREEIKKREHNEKTEPNK